MIIITIIMTFKVQFFSVDHRWLLLPCIIICNNTINLINAYVFSPHVGQDDAMLILNCELHL